MSVLRQREIKLPPCAQGGFSLVELMVALTIGLFLVIGLVSLLVSISHSRTELDKTSRQIENGRYALQLISTDVQHAGFLGNYAPPLAPPTTGPTWTTPDPCDPAVAAFFPAPSDPTVVPAAILTLPVMIFGYDGATAVPACLSNRVAGTAVLVVRRVSTTTTAAAAPVAGETYLQVAACAPITKPFIVSAAAFPLQTKDCDGTLAPLNKYIVRAYYISSCNVCAPSDGIPTLKMAEFVNGAMSVTPLVEGIQNLQVDYGIDMNDDGSPDCYISNPSSPAAAQTTAALCPQPAINYEWDPALRAAAVPPLAPHWANVVSARIYVLARNNEPTADWTDTRTYDLGKAGTYTPAAGDKYKRHVYSAVARATNIAGRRELP